MSRIQWRRLFSFLLLAGLLLGFVQPAGVLAARAPQPQTAPAKQEDASAKIEPLVQEQIAASGSTDFFIWMKEKADLSPAKALKTKADKGQFVFDALRATADRTQKDLRAYLDQQGAEYKAFYIANKILVRGGDENLLNTVAARSDVSQIKANHTIKLIDPAVSAPPDTGDPLTIEPNISFVNADDVWALGYTGEGIVLAGNDTGLQWDHPAIKNHYRGWNGATADHNYNWWDSTGTYPTAPNDVHGHGTHTTGTMVGDDGAGNQIGMAPGAKTIHCKLLDDSGSGDDGMVTECFEWDLAPWDLNGLNPDPSKAPDAINNSWGYSGGGYGIFEDEIANMQAAGIYMAFSAGNDGPNCMTLGSPGDYDQVMTTGAVDSAFAYPGNLAGFSSRGPSSLHPGSYIPDITAPGVNIRSSVPGGGYQGGWSGTSMASPHTTGLVGLLWSASPSLIGQIDLTTQIITETAGRLVGQGGSNCGGDYVSGPNNDWGYGTIDAYAAVMASMGGETGTLQGHVYETSSGDPISGASVVAEPQAAGGSITTITDPTGFYTMDLFSGTYDVTASKANYTSQTVTGVVINVGETTTQDFELTFNGAWTQLDPLPGCPDWTRYDGEYFPGTGKVYFLGGRSGTSTYGDIYALDLDAGTCTDTTKNMLVAISNYTIVPLNDGSADVLCTFGGRDSAGANTSAVQCFDPIANTVTQPTNLQGGLVGFTPGGAAAVNNKAYVFGGFRNTASPYETPETWEWDPVANTWAQKGDLVEALGYLQVAVADGMIYGFGGTQFDGTNLNAQTIAQVFDPVAGSWDDGAVTDMATASAEGRCYGFDTGSPYQTAGTIICAGGGMWPAETAAAFQYDFAADTYDDSFPDLNIMRRDHAGVFVPVDTGTLWVFGGRTSAAGYGGDNPPYAPPEYYTLAEHIELQPDIELSPSEFVLSVVEGQSTSDTLTIGNVGTADLTWNIEEEAPPAAPLAWSDDFESYAVGSDLHGQGGWKGWGNNPAAGALVSDAQSHSPTKSAAIEGASDLVHEYAGYTTGQWVYTAWQYVPTDFSGTSYFILLNQYDDAGMNLNWSTEINFDSGTKLVSNDGPDGGTLPLIQGEWVELRVEIDLDADTQAFYYNGDLLFLGSWTDGMSGGGILNIAAVDLYANSATVVYYDDVSLAEPVPPVCSNPGDVTWLSVDPASGTTLPGEASDVTVGVDGTGLTPGDVLSANLCVNSNDPVTPLIPVPVTVTVEAQVFGVDLEPEDSAGSGLPGATVDYTLTLENTGNVEDTFEFSVSNVWFVTLPAPVTLAAGASADVTVSVTVPADAPGGAMDTALVTATSQTDGTVADTVNVTTTAETVYGVDLSPETDAKSGEPGELVEYTLILTNLGNVEDTFEFSVSGNLWDVTLPFPVTLGVGSSDAVTVFVTVPAGANDGDFDVSTITATSQGDGSTDSSTLTTTAMVEEYLVFLPVIATR